MTIGPVAQIVRQQSEAREAHAYARFAEAVDTAERELRRPRPVDRPFLTLARRLDRGDAPITLAEHRLALQLLQQACSQCEPSIDLFTRAIHAHRIANLTSEATSLATEGLSRFPHSARLQAFEALTLPCFYATDQAIDAARVRYAEGLSRWGAGLDLATDAGRVQALDAVAHHVNFFLPAQGRDDLQLQRTYGDIVHRVMSACFPHALPLKEADALAAGERLRVGFVSSHFHQHSVFKTHGAWIRRLDRRRLDLYTYAAGTIVDTATDDIRAASRRFTQTADLNAMIQAIGADRPHVLIYLDVGMRPMVTQLAALRLAPLQAATWGHPETTGLPVIDAFLSSELMEPEEGDAHYREELVRLPGIGVCFEAPHIPVGVFWQTRRDFGLRDDAMVYLCCQSLHKYLPSYDDLLAAIAEQVSHARFVFLVPNPIAGDHLRRRLDDSFRARQLDAGQHCILLPPQSPISYWALNRVADVFLDSTGWSGCNSTLEAIACRLPVVTMAGHFMRGRHSSAILTQLGVVDTIASDASEFVATAVRLAQDVAWRRDLIARMSARSSAVFGDTRSVEALEEWVLTVIRPADRRLL
jgi:protein O-GlcNAc transferase